MDSSLLGFLEQFSYSLNVVDQTFKSSYGCERIAAALIHLSKRVQADPTKLHNCKSLLNESLKFFHPFRGIDLPIITSYMATANDPNWYLSSALKAYECLKAHFPMGYLAPSSAIAMETVPSDLIPSKISALKGVSQYFGSKYPMSQRSDKLPSFLMITMTEDPNETVKNADALYELIRPNHRFHAFSYATVLCLDSKDNDTKARELHQFINAAKQRGTPFEPTYSYSQYIGFLSLAPIPNKAQFFTDVAEVSKWMTSNRNYLFRYGLYSGSRNNLAALLLLYYYASQGYSELIDYAIMCTYAYVNAASIHAHSQNSSST
ncbi:MAG: DUF4003 family protein [Clostridia bacterium]|nr:DUF4003 family protein [Clostridia bacterium]